MTASEIGVKIGKKKRIEKNLLKKDSEKSLNSRLSCVFADLVEI